ncbi:MAG: hypothetical protein AUF76_03525 [Acidobacteria bacterium 13_1_20CM_2_65_9]|nr:MAG: hypothetical protein AUF76_03525 [Acidobacteria bacterium 13_1_20CM_2_65_9]
MPMIALILWAAIHFAQSGTGELRLTVTDPAGLPIQSAVDIVSQANEIRQRFDTDDRGTLTATRLPFGTYHVEVARNGFATFSGLVEIRSALPTEYRVTLSLAPVQTQVTVGADDTVLDQHRTSTLNHIGAEAMQHRLTALPGRSLPDLVNTQPGWLLEANGVLHPRGSEYQTQYVVDGLPLTDNRSPAFAPELEADDVHAMTVLTAGYPAEYGRKLGGVIEVVTAGNARRGFHGSVAASIGSFTTASGYAMGEYGWGRNTFGVSGNVARTDRYLDPPVEENFTNSGRGTNVAMHFERALTDADRVGLIARHAGATFSVPNERVQEEAGQAQDRDARETAGQFSYQHMFSAQVLDVRGLARDISAGLSSNPRSTPIAPPSSRDTPGRPSQCRTSACRKKRGKHRTGTRAKPPVSFRISTCSARRCSTCEAWRATSPPACRRIRGRRRSRRIRTVGFVSCISRRPSPVMPVRTNGKPAWTATSPRSGSSSAIE